MRRKWTMNQTVRAFQGLNVGAVKAKWSRGERKREEVQHVDRNSDIRGGGGERYIKGGCGA